MSKVITKFQKPKRTKREKSTTTEGHYITNAVLLPEVIRAKELGYITPELVQMIRMIAEKYSRKSWFIGYSFREDMVSAAVMNLCNSNNALKFNPEKYKNTPGGPNPFSYYTTAIHHTFQHFKAAERRENDTKNQLMMDAGVNPSFGFEERLKEKIYGEDSQNDFFDAEESIDAEESDSEDKVEEDSSIIDPKKSGPVTVYSPNEMVYDENLGYFVKKEV